MKIAVVASSLFFSGHMAAAAEVLPAYPGAPSLSAPIDCVMGKPGKSGCFVHTAMDHDVGMEIRDYQCGARAYNARSSFGRAHQGTDIGPLDWRDIERDIPVLAASSGQILGIRDGIPDEMTLKGQLPPELKGKECGNGVVIGLQGGWRLQYCHMRNESLTVKAGDQVTRGQVLGYVGASGRATLPHLHFQVMLRHEGKLVPVDPYDGTRIDEDCSVTRPPLWDLKAGRSLALKPAEMIKMGLASRAVNGAALVKGLRPEQRLSVASTPLSVFATFAGSRPGDKISFTVVGPDGAPEFSTTAVLKHYQQRQWLASDLSKARRFKKVPGDRVVRFVLERGSDRLLDETTIATLE